MSAMFVLILSAWQHETKCTFEQDTSWHRHPDLDTGLDLDSDHSWFDLWQKVTTGVSHWLVKITANLLLPVFLVGFCLANVWVLLSTNWKTVAHINQPLAVTKWSVVA